MLLLLLLILLPLLLLPLLLPLLLLPLLPLLLVKPLWRRDAAFESARRDANSSANSFTRFRSR